MTYQQFIDNTLRRYTRDLRTLSQNVWDGDGVNLTFSTTYRPILENTYTVKVGGVVQTEGSAYTLDKDSGIITFVSAPAAGSDNVTLDYSYVNFRNDDWLQAINSGIRHFRKKIFGDSTNTAQVTVVGQGDYDLSSLIGTNVFDVISVEARSSSTEDWSDIGVYGSGWTFLREQQSLRLSPAPQRVFSLRIRYTTIYAEGAALTDTLPIASKYLDIYRYWAMAEYFERVAATTISNTASVTREGTFQTLPNTTNFARLFRDQAEQEASKVRPLRPEKELRIPGKGKSQ